MKIYIVENGNFIFGYYLKKENALKAMADNNTLINSLNGNTKAKYLDTKPCYITEVETED